jgi:hypothetical protein
MKHRKLIAHTILDVVELSTEFGLRLVKRTGIYERGLKASFEAAKMPLSDELLTDVAEENITMWEDRLASIMLAFREAVDAGSLVHIAVGPKQWRSRAWPVEEPERVVPRDAN